MVVTLIDCALLLLRFVVMWVAAVWLYRVYSGLHDDVSHLFACHAATRRRLQRLEEDRRAAVGSDTDDDPRS